MVHKFKHLWGIGWKDCFSPLKPKPQWWQNHDVGMNFFRKIWEDGWNSKHFNCGRKCPDIYKHGFHWTQIQTPHIFLCRKCWNLCIPFLKLNNHTGISNKTHFEFPWVWIVLQNALHILWKRQHSKRFFDVWFTKKSKTIAETLCLLYHCRSILNTGITLFPDVTSITSFKSDFIL